MLWVHFHWNSLILLRMSSLLRLIQILSNITILINTLNVGTVNLNENNMMFGFNMGGKHELLLNTLISISKWSIW
jgi:hypothetical protein